MNRHLLTAAVSASAIALAAMLPLPSYAFSGELISITPAPLEDITDMIEPDEETPAEIVMAGWIVEEGIEYTTVFSVDSEPSVVVNPGGNIALDNRWTYNADTGTVTVPFTATGMKQIDDAPTNVAIVAMVPPVPLGEDGPPAEMNGAWLSTNVQNWEMIPPSEEQMAFGFILTGPAGETGFLNMFVTDAVIGLLSQFNGEELTAEDLAIYNGDSLSSVDVAEVEGGVYISINVTFTESVVAVSAKGNNSGVTKSITVRKQLPLSIAAARTSIREGRNARLFGWVRNAKKGQRISVWRKTEDESKMTKWRTAKLKKNGAYDLVFAPEETATYQVKYHKKGKTRRSAKQVITVVQ